MYLGSHEKKASRILSSAKPPRKKNIDKAVARMSERLSGEKKEGKKKKTAPSGRKKSIRVEKLAEPKEETQDKWKNEKKKSRPRAFDRKRSRKRAEKSTVLLSHERTPTGGG